MNFQIRFIILAPTKLSKLLRKARRANIFVEKDNGLLFILALSVALDAKKNKLKIIAVRVIS